MRILITISSLRGGGAERAVVTLSRMWVDSGHDVRVLTISSSEHDAYRLDARVSRAELDLERSSSSSAAAIWNSALRLLRLKREMRRYDPDVIVAFMPTASILSALAAFGTRTKVIGCERTFPPQAPLGPVREFVRRWGYGLLDAVVAQTGKSADWLRTNTRARVIKTISNPATWPLQQNPPMVPPESVCRPGRQILLAAGRLELEKGFAGLLRVFSDLCGKHPDWDLVIVGEGSLRPEFERFIAARNLTERAFLPGRVGNMADWYSRASIFVLSSIFEGFPNALTEALAYGLPAVSYDCDTGPRDIIRDGIDGVLVPNGQPQLLADALRRLMRNDEERQRMSQRAPEIRQRLSEELIAQDWRSVFDQLAMNPDSHR